MTEQTLEESTEANGVVKTHSTGHPVAAKRSGAVTVTLLLAAAAVAAALLVWAPWNAESDAPVIAEASALDAGGTAPTPSEGGALRYERVESIPAERARSMDPVTGASEAEIGYIDPGRQFHRNADGTAPGPIPIYSPEGEHVAWWGYVMGWLSFDEVNADGFDYQEAIGATEARNREMVEGLERG